MSCNYEYVYACKWFMNKRCKKPYTTMFYKDPTDTHWIYATCDYLEDRARIEYVRVCKNSGSYETAVHNSLSLEDKKKIDEANEKRRIKIQIIQELHNQLSHS